uniref:Retrotransposon protein, putative, Ty1-copia subclass n=1 Tax=Tanacetum cinerariifolium TaxID=118510 RepID=A0A6L2KSZ0_TANCI|nr:hypothetical protein [Tanacetum cinerariifolium]
MAARGQNHEKGKNKLTYAPKSKIPPPPKREDPTKDSICHEYGEIGHWKRNCLQYLSELLKKKKLSQGASNSGIFTIELNTFLNRSWIYETGCGTHICNTTHGLRESRKLKLGSLSLYVGNGQREAVEAIGHCRLRHISKKRTEKLQHDGLLNSTYLWAFEKCVSCMSEKMARKPYTHLVEMAKDLLGLIHTDGRVNESRVFGSFKGSWDYRPSYSSLHVTTQWCVGYEKQNPTRYGSIHDESKTLPKSFWDYALETATRILNMVPTKKVEKIPYEVWHGQAPKLSYLKVWGCEALFKRDTLTKPDKLEHRAHHKREYDSKVNERHMQTIKEKVDTSKALDASLVDTKSSETESVEQDTRSKSGNDAHADDANIIPIYDEEPREEAKKKTLECGRSSRPSVMPSARLESTTIGSKPKPQINNQKSRKWPASKSSCKCVFNANHDSCVTKLLKEVNSRAKVPSNKTTNINKPVEQISVAKQPERQIPKGHRFSIKKTSVVHEKTMTPRSCLRWKPTGKIFKTVGLRWVPTGKIFTSSTTKVASEPTNGSNADITNQYECEQTLDVSACTSFNPKTEGLRVWLLKRLISQILGLQGILI